MNPIAYCIAASAMLLAMRFLGVIATPLWLCLVPLALAVACALRIATDRPHHLEDA